MTSDEGMMRAANVMREAAETNHRAADRIEEAVRQMQILFDAGYGGTVTRLIEELEKANSVLKADVCEWTPTETGGGWFYDTTCGVKGTSYEPTPFCPHCGRKVKVTSRPALLNKGLSIKEEQAMGEQMTAREAVFGFAAWLTCRQKAITLGAAYDSASVVDLVKQWCDTNKLSPVREGMYPGNIIQPPSVEVAGEGGMK